MVLIKTVKLFGIVGFVTVGFVTLGKLIDTIVFAGIASKFSTLTKGGVDG